MYKSNPIMIFVAFCLVIFENPWLVGLIMQVQGHSINVDFNAKNQYVILSGQVLNYIS